MGRPRLFVGVTAGNLDSMLNKLTAQKKVRSEDQYSPGGRTEPAPEPRDASSTRTCAARRFPGCRSCSAASRRRSGASPTTTTGPTRCAARCCSTPRRICSCSAWASARRGRSRERLAAGEPLADLRDVRGTAHVTGTPKRVGAARRRPSRYVTDGKVVVLALATRRCCDDKAAFARMVGSFQLETNPINARPLLQAHGSQAVYFNPPALPAGRGGDGRALRPAVQARARTRPTANSRSRRSRR